MDTDLPNQPLLKIRRTEGGYLVYSHNTLLYISAAQVLCSQRLTLNEGRDGRGFAGPRSMLMLMLF
jgi:hypothetical protein